MIRSGFPRLKRTAAGVACVALGLGCAGLALANGDVSSPHGRASAPAASSKKPAAAETKLIDINSASRKELKTLPGIGDAEADRIVAGRPYLSKTDLATAKVIPTGIYVSIRRSIVAIQKAKPNGKA